MNRSHLQRWLCVCALTLATGCTVNVHNGPDAGGMGGAAGMAGMAGMAGAGGMAGMAGMGGSTSMEIDDAINMLGRYTPEVMQVAEVDAPDGAPTEDRCGAVRYWERTARFTSIGAEATHGPELFPGNVVNGDDAINGRLTRINAPLAPVTFSVSLQNTDAVSGELPTPSLTSFRQERNRLLNAAMSATADARIKFSVAAVNTAEEMSTALGGDVSYFGLASFSSRLSFSEATYKSRFVISFEQTYYTVDTEPKDAPSEHFASGAMPSFGSPPLYVRSIRYGRRVLLFVKSTHYEQEASSALQVGFAGDVLGQVSFGSNFSSSQRAVFNSMEITGVVIGGSASNAVQLATGDLSALNNLLNEGAEFSSANPGEPIDFQLAYLTDNSLADLSVTSAYETHSCIDMNVVTTLIDACGDPGCLGQFFGPIHVYVTEDPEDPCGVARGTVVGGPGANWSGGSRILPQIQVPSGADRPVCVYGHLYEEDTFSNDDYGQVYSEFTLPRPPMTSVEDEIALSDGLDDLTYHTRIDVLGVSPIPLD